MHINQRSEDYSHRFVTELHGWTLFKLTSLTNFLLPGTHPLRVIKSIK